MPHKQPSGAMPNAGLLGLLTVLGPVSMDLYLPGLTDVSRSLHLGRVAASGTLFTCLAGLAVGQILWGQVIDRLGKRGPLLAAISVWVLSSAGCALAVSGAMLISLRAVQGLAGGCGMTVARAVLAQRLSGHRLAAGLARIALVTNVCAVSAPLAGGALLSAVGWRGLFLVLTGCGVAVGLLAALVFNDQAAPGPWLAEQRSGRGGTRLRDLLVPLRSPRYRCGAAIAMVSFAQVILYVSIAPAMLRGHYGLGGAPFGVAFAVTVAALVGGTRVAPLVLRRFRRRPGALVAACLAAAAAAAVQAGAGAVDAWPPLALTVALFALGNAASGILFALGATEALSGTTAGAGAAAGLLGGLQFGGGAALATLATTTGVRTLGGYGLAGTAMCLLSAGLAVLADRRSGTPGPTFPGGQAAGVAAPAGAGPGVPCRAPDVVARAARSAARKQKSGAIGFIEHGN
jgi:MFS transporter, DHA1 family, multidrug resistance protein